MADHPLKDCFETASEFVAGGATVYQKFTCTECDNRLTIEEANTFYTAATCDRCGKVTDIRKNGCNYMLILRYTDG
jgi:predicted RNA-binding Zn-ribbon protein involved in translation (DUF1610 family)